MTQTTRLTLDGTGGRLAADHLPGAGTPIVYLHGLGSARTGTKGERMLELAAARGRELYRLDLRGHGDSEGTIGDATISGLCEDTAALLDLTGQAIVVGSSLGGLVGAWTAARHPDRVPALALIAPAFGMLDRLVGGSQLEGGTACGVTVGDHVIEDARRFDETALPAKLNMPVWVVQGACDEVVPVAATQRVCGAIPGGVRSLWIVEGADHRLDAHLDGVFGALGGFLDEHAAG